MLFDVPRFVDILFFAAVTAVSATALPPLKTLPTVPTPRYVRGSNKISEVNAAPLLNSLFSLASL